MTVDQILSELRLIGSPTVARKKAEKFNINAKNTLGLYQRDINVLVKKLPKDPELAIALFDTEIYEARIICGKLFPPGQLTRQLADAWVATFDNWEICDTFSMKIFARSSLAELLIRVWAVHEELWVKRAAYATIAGLCSADKKSDNHFFLQFLPIIEQGALDNRHYVKMGVSWALRSIGKRNIDLKTKSIELGQKLAHADSASAQWVGRDVLKELNQPDVRISDYPRAIYRPS